MSKNRIDGAAAKAAGTAKEAIGKMTGDKELQAKGAIEKNVGAAQNAVGKAQDKIADKIKK